ncbi:MAG: hypothetical protein JWL83_1736 [Actinomycetia bacterium]|nr:hypothetical protein [Actinomycetes bacterium]
MPDREADEADVQEQLETADGDEIDNDPIPKIELDDAEVPEADALEQAMEVAYDEDDR